MCVREMEMQAYRGCIRCENLSKYDKMVLLHSPLFHDVDQKLTDELIAGGTLRTWKKGEYLFFDEDPIGKIYFVFSGKMREYYSNGDGNECLRQLHGPGGYISLHLIFSQEIRHTYSCEVVSEASCFVWDITDLQEILNRNPEFGCRVGMVLGNYLEASCRKICICRKNQAVTRVAGYLLSLDMNAQGGCVGTLKLAKPRALANIKPVGSTANEVCMARETFSRAISTLQGRRLISVRQGEVEIIDIEGLKKVSGIS